MADKRLTITLKLDPDTDADLWQWFQGLPDGKRNQMLKNGLRELIGLPTVEYNPVEAELNAMRHEMATVRSLIGKLPDTIRHTSQSTVDGRLAQLDGVLNAVQNHADWIKHFEERLNSLSVAPESAVVKQEVYSGVSEEERELIERRERKLKKAQW